MIRTLDILFAALALIVLSPLLLTIALILWLTGEGEVFFCQQRVGKDGSQFGLIKFATMLKDSPNMNAGTVTLKFDPRVLPVGRFLRKTKINELPQLINILMGDMSVIGPRPQTKRCFEAFPAEFKNIITQVRPGLSGIGSIVFRDEEDLMDSAENAERFYDDVIMPYKGALEAWYVRNASLWNYLRMILLTVWVVVFPKRDRVEEWFRDLPEAPEALQGRDKAAQKL